jgi:hypothetical protein
MPYSWDACGIVSPLSFPSVLRCSDLGVSARRSIPRTVLRGGRSSKSRYALRTRSGPSRLLTQTDATCHIRALLPETCLAIAESSFRFVRWHIPHGSRCPPRFGGWRRGCQTRLVVVVNGRTILIRNRTIAFGWDVPSKFGVYAGSNGHTLWPDHW